MFVSLVVVLVVVLDQVTKMWIRGAIPLHESVEVIPSLFNLTHVRNPGGAFNLLARSDESFRVPFFLIMTTVAVAALFYFLREIRPHQKLLLFAVAGVLGGAIGNFIDRATVGEVTDFLDVYWGSYHWPSFNVADSFISVGVVVLIVHSLFFAEDDAR
jgi:signal peptidase II